MNASAAAIAGGTGSTRRARCHVDPGCSRLLCCIQSDEPGSWLHTVQHSQPLRLLPEAYRYFRAHATDEQLLEKLSLESLSITSLLKEIGSLEKLRELQLGDNPDLQTLPRELATRKLTTLRLARTDNLTSFHFPNKFLKRLHEVYRKDIQAQCLDNDRYASVVLALREMSNFNFEQLEPVKKACKNYDGEQGAPESHIPELLLAFAKCYYDVEHDEYLPYRASNADIHQVIKDKGPKADGRRPALEIILRLEP